MFSFQVKELENVFKPSPLVMMLEGKDLMWQVQILNQNYESIAMSRFWLTVDKVQTHAHTERHHGENGANEIRAPRNM